ncbi:MAG: carboxypeptidase regulatory-like domain-containing protein [Candidatus Hydrogenedentes bacterium]|nr:carboxypeptidase regulatory-like domain-containing protein [Candidatus Hydrogenedentota bacterium]
MVSEEVFGTTHGADGGDALIQPNEQGEFTIENLPYGRYAVEAEAEGQIAWATCSLTRETPVADVLLVLHDPTGIAGRVVDATGTGLAAAVVYPLRHDGIALRREEIQSNGVVTDGQGKFSLLHLEEGDWVLQAAAQGFAATTSATFPSGTREALIQLDAGVSVSGRIVERSAPAMDVRLTLATAGSNAPEVAARSDEEGVFTFETVGPGNYELRGEKAGRIVKDAPVRISVADKAQEGLVLELVQGGTLHGHVIDQDSGSGVPEVIVKALLEDGSRLSHLSEASDGEGRFAVMGLNPGTYQVYPKEAPGYSRSGRGLNPLMVTVMPGENIEGVTILLGRGIVVSGHVVDTGGNPVEGAFVHGRQAGWQDQQTTGKDGAFTLARLNGGETIKVLASTTSARSPEYTLDIPPEGLSEVELVLEIPCEGLIAGVVVDSRSQPFRGQLSLSLADEGSYHTTNRTATDAKGRFLFPNVAAGSYRIGALPEQGTGQSIFEIHMKEGQQIRDLRLVFQQEDFLEIAGRVVDDGGSPRAANLRLDQQDGLNTSSQSMGQTAVDGTFRFKGLSEGTYAITASATGYSDAVVRDIQAGARDVNIVLSSRLSIRGYVVTKKNVPITDFEVVVVQSGVDVDSLGLFVVPFKYFSNSEGAYSLAVDEGDYDVVARASGYAMGRATVGRVAPGYEADDVIIVLEKRSPILGRVIDGEGRPVPGTAIFLGALPDGAERLTGYAAMVTDSEGQFELWAPEADRVVHLSAFHRAAGIGEFVGSIDSDGIVEIALIQSGTSREPETVEAE